MNVVGWMDDIWLLFKYNFWSDVKPVNVVGWMDDKLLSSNFNSRRENKPLNVSGSIVSIFL